MIIYCNILPSLGYFDIKIGFNFNGKEVCIVYLT